MFRACAGLSVTDLPATRMSPPVTVSRPAIIRRVVDLPQPEGPSRPEQLPGVQREVDAPYRVHRRPAPGPVRLAQIT